MLQERTGDPEQPVGDPSQGPSIGVAPLTQSGIANAALGISLDGRSRPVEDGVAQPLMSRIAHDNKMGFAAALCDRRDPGQGPERGIIAAAERPRRLGEQNGQRDPTNPGQGPCGWLHHSPDYSPDQRLSCSRPCRAHRACARRDGVRGWPPATEPRENAGEGRPLNEFSDRQVFIFTHDDQWFTELRYRLPHDRWAFKTLIPWRSPALGSAWDARGEDFGVARALLEGDPSAAANKARGLMDVHMAIIAELLEVRVPHVRGSRNELRNALDLLQRFRSRANDKLRHCDPDGSYKKWQIPIDAAHAAATLLVPWGNSASHGRRVARSEAEQLIDQCEAVISALACDACKTPVWHAKVANQHLRCSCDAVRWLS